MPASCTPFQIPRQCDRLYGWKSAPDTPIRDAFKRQKDFVMKEFDTRSEQVFLQLNEQVGARRSRNKTQLRRPLLCSWLGCCLQLFCREWVRGF